jgi:cell division protein FtsB
MTQKSHVMWLAVGAALVLAGVSASTEGGARRYFRLQSDVKQLQARNKFLSEDNAQLRREVEGMRSDVQIIERAAREELGLVRAGETIFALEE